MPLRFGSVCSGIEAASVAWKPLGWSCSFVSEIEPFPCAVLAHHYPDVPNLGDMTKITEADLARCGPIDLLVGGTPGQSFSVAGLRAGMADPRGNLALVFLALLGRTRARWVVWENVPGVLSSNGGRDFGAFLGGLGQLGYGWAYRVLDAQYFGLSQRRRRVFVVGCLGDWRGPVAVLFERESLRGNPAPSRETGARVAASLTRGADSGGRGGYAGRRQEDDVNLVGCLDANSGGPDDNDAQRGLLVAHAVACHETCPSLTANTASTGHDGLDERIVAHSIRAEGFDASEDGTGRGTPLVVNMMGCKSSANVSDDGLSPSLNAMHGHDVHAVLAGSVKAHHQGGGTGPETTYVPVAFRATFSNQGMEEGMVPTMDAQPMAVGVGTHVRRLTPRECERLQGFPDDYTLIPYRSKPAKDAPRYRALGNSMAVPCMRWIGERIDQVEAKDGRDFHVHARLAGVL